MKKKHFLPICQPDFVCHYIPTCSNAILKANAVEKEQILLCSKYINCYYEKTSIKHKIVISIFDHWCVTQKFIQNQFINLFKETYQKDKNKLVLKIKKCLLNDSYVLGKCKRTYVEDNIDNNKSLFYYVITGFNDITHEFTMYGIDSLNKFSCFRIAYQRFVEAFFDTSEQNIIITMRRCNKDMTISFDIPNIIFELEDYINSTNRRNQCINDNVYGLNAFKELCLCFYDVGQNGFALDELDLYNFSVHKIYMRNRTECLASYGIIDEKWVEQAEQVSKMGTEVLELGKFFNNTYEQSAIERLVEIMSEIIEIESNYLPCVLKELKNYEKINN